MVLRKSELLDVLKLESEMRGPRGCVYDPISGFYKKLEKGGPTAGPFEERIDEKGHVTYHQIKKCLRA